MRRGWVLLLVAIVALGVAGCSVQKAETGEVYQIYLLTDFQSAAGADAISPVSVELDVSQNATLEERASAVVEKILSSGSALWTGIKLQNVTIQGRRAYVDFNRRYAGLTGIQLSLADYCITLSLTQLEGITSVTTTAEGQELSYRSSQVLMEQDVLLSSMDDVIERVTVSLYFADENGELVPEQRALEVYEGQTLAESTIAALLDGPQERGLHAVIPEGFQISSVRVEDRVCTLNIPEESIACLPDESDVQRLILQSFAKTIYSWGTVDEIQILVDGEPCELFGSVPVAEVQFRPAEETGQE